MRKCNIHLKEELLEKLWQLYGRLPWSIPSESFREFSGRVSLDSFIEVYKK